MSEQGRYALRIVFAAARHPYRMEYIRRTRLVHLTFMSFHGQFQSLLQQNVPYFIFHDNL
jgi:hypothetical protein